jgi:3-deoxy-D-manno-octulosonic-acid transferase
MSARSLRTWRRFPGAARAVLGAFDLILARDRADGARFEALGARVDGVWDAKLGAPPLPADEGELGALRETLAGRPVILAASTHAGEDAIIARAFARAAGDAPGPRLVIVPRHPGRGEEMTRVVRGEGLTVARRAAGEDFAAARVLVADTLGELGLWYRLARLAVIGGSLVEGVGGHNPLEPARLKCPFIAGRHVEHWPIYRDLVGAGATHLVEGEADLTAWLSDALAGGPALPAMAARAADYAAGRDEEGAAVVPRLLALLAP